MKIDFKNIDSSRVNVGTIFYLYGNYKKTFEAFCDFVQDELRKKSFDLKIHFCSIVECLKIINGQCDLFETAVDCFCIRNVEDNHLESIAKFFSEKNRVFILESGNYMKSKKVTEHLLKNEALAIASFNNEITFNSLVRMFFPNIPYNACSEIVKIISNTDEDLRSLFKKTSLLSSDSAFEDLKEYSTSKQSFLSGLDLIPLIRFLLQTTMKERISTNFSKISPKNKDAVHNLLNAELAIKSGSEISRGYVYGGIG